MHFFVDVFFIQFQIDCVARTLIAVSLPLLQRLSSPLETFADVLTISTNLHDIPYSPWRLNFCFLSFGHSSLNSQFDRFADLIVIFLRFSLVYSTIIVANFFC